MKRDDIKLYNVIFPIWLLVIFPVAWLVVIPANILIDSLVLCLSMKKYRIPNLWAAYRKSIIKVVLFGFFADIIGGLFMLASQLADRLPLSVEGQRWIYEHFTSPVMYNPFQSILSLIWVLAAMAISSLFIYFLNSKFSFRNTELDPAAQKKLSRILAILTTPILFLLPTIWF